MENLKRILVSPLNWGIGHAVRDIPLIKFLASAGHVPIIAADGHAYDLLKAEFPDLLFVRLPFVSIRYSATSSQVLILALQAPKILFGVVSEHFAVRKIVKKYNIDVIISDNRFGLWNRGIKTFYITHQVFIKMPSSLRFLERFFVYAHRFFINKFDYLVVPDSNDGFSLAGDLVAKYTLLPRCIFVGALSRFVGCKPDVNEKSDSVPDLLFVLSGPEPQRTIFEKKIIDNVKRTDLKCFLVRGVNHENPLSDLPGNLDYVNFLNGEYLYKKIKSAKYIICRSGYTGIMDLLAVGKDATLIPTPGQTEQEYLADYLNEKGIFYSQKQSLFDIDCILKQRNNFSVNRVTVKFNRFDKIINFI